MTIRRPSGDRAGVRDHHLGLGEGKIAPLLPEITDPETLARLYRLLTARDPITPSVR